MTGKKDIQTFEYVEKVIEREVSEAKNNNQKICIYIGSEDDAEMFCV